MAKHGKNHAAAKTQIDRQKRYSIEDGIKLALESHYAKFDASVDVAVRLGVDPRHADQMVRGAVVLPHGIGKTVRILVFARGEKEAEAKAAGADFVGNDDLIEKIQGGWMDFDKAVATPDMMGAVGKIGKLLGPRGLMPNAKVGTVTFDVAKAIGELKAGKVDFRVEKAGIVHAPVGRVSFGPEKVKDNLIAFLDKLVRMKPSTAKGTYLKSIAISTSMGPGIKLDATPIRDLVK
jgi:large subunit ribosomal protein L1